MSAAEANVAAQVGKNAAAEESWFGRIWNAWFENPNRSTSAGFGACSSACDSEAGLLGSAGVAKNTVVATYSPLNPGPLSAEIANTFRSGTHAEMVAQQPTTLYRVYGGTANQMGGYWTQVPSAGPVQSIIDSALLPQWGNTATNVVKIEIPAGTRYFTGAAAPQGGLVGGGNQVAFPPGVRVDSSWIKTP